MPMQLPLVVYGNPLHAATRASTRPLPGRMSPTPLSA